MNLPELNAKLDGLATLISYQEDKGEGIAMAGKKLIKISDRRPIYAELSAFFNKWTRSSDGLWVSFLEPENIQVGGTVSFLDIDYGENIRGHGHDTAVASDTRFPYAHLLRPSFEGLEFIANGEQFIKLRNGTFFVPVKGSRILHGVNNVAFLGERFSLNYNLKYNPEKIMREGEDNYEAVTVPNERTVRAICTNAPPDDIVSRQRFLFLGPKLKPVENEWTMDLKDWLE